MNYDAIAFWSQIAGFALFVACLFGRGQMADAGARGFIAKASNERIALAERHRDEMRAAVESLRHEIDGANLMRRRSSSAPRSAREHERERDRRRG